MDPTLTQLDLVPLPISIWGIALELVDAAISGVAGAVIVKLDFSVATNSMYLGVA